MPRAERAEGDPGWALRAYELAVAAPVVVWLVVSAVTDPERFVDLLTGFIASTEPARFAPDRWVQRLRSGRPTVVPAADPPEPVDEVQLTA